MHYLIALVLWLGFIAWIVRASSTGTDGAPAWLRWAGRLSMGGAVAACAAVAAIVTGMLPQLQDDPAAAPSSYVIPATARYAPAYAANAMPLPIPVGTTSAAGPARVRVVPGTGLRAQPSRNASVLRVAQGGVLKRFATANGWIQVGVARPEGWVLESAAVPAG